MGVDRLPSVRPDQRCEDHPSSDRGSFDPLAFVFEPEGMMKLDIVRIFRLFCSEAFADCSSTQSLSLKVDTSRRACGRRPSPSIRAGHAQTQRRQAAERHT